MIFFLDSANIDEIKKCEEMHLLDGITTNPSLMSKTVKHKDEVYDIYKEICKICKDRPVSCEIVDENYEDMMKEAEKLRKISDYVCIKLPITEDGLKACYDLTQDGTMTNMTLCFSPMQALLCAKNGATFVSPFLGRVDDMGFDGLELVSNIMQIYANYGYETQVLAASIRSIKQVEQVALMGCDVATMPFNIITQLIKHPATDAGLVKFANDFKKIS